MTPEDSRKATLQKELGDLIDALELSDLRKRFLRSRWLDQVFWLEARAKQNQRRYNSLRLITIVAGVVVPALVGLNVRKENVTTALAWITFALSLTVALAAALDGFFHYGDRWRNYRRTAEGLKSQGWLFLQLAGPYAGFASHAKAYPVFAGQVESLIQQDVEFFITHVVRDGKADEAGTGRTGAEVSAGS